MKNKISPVLELWLCELRDYALETAAANGMWPLNAADDCLRMITGRVTFLFQPRPESTDLKILILDGDYDTALIGAWQFRKGLDRLSVRFFRPGAEALLMDAIASSSLGPARETLH
jgi:hypothetical protein